MESGDLGNVPARKAENSKPETLNSKKIQSSKFKIPDSANRKIRIISAWRYPGVSPKNNPVPKDILEEIQAFL
jgi:hypothetical protein